MSAGCCRKENESSLGQESHGAGGQETFTLPPPKTSNFGLRPPTAPAARAPLFKRCKVQLQQPHQPQLRTPSALYYPSLDPVRNASLYQKNLSPICLPKKPFSPRMPLHQCPSSRRPSSAREWSTARDRSGWTLQATSWWKERSGIGLYVLFGHVNVIV